LSSWQDDWTHTQSNKLRVSEDIRCGVAVLSLRHEGESPTFWLDTFVWHMDICCEVTGTRLY
jgi:hypothetical protein